jgi:uncharacterized protein YhdP
LVDNLTAHVSRQQQGWQFDIPTTRITMDGNPWPQGSLAFAWVPAQETGGQTISAVMNYASAPVVSI